MKYKVISLHCYPECDIKPRCSFCYKAKTKGKLKPERFWFELIKYISKLTKQVALGGGEPWVKPKFVKKLAKECKKYKLILNITSNGRALMKMNDKELKESLKNIKMISLSFDKEKVRTDDDLLNYMNLVTRIKKLTNCQVGCNLLVDQRMFRDKGRPFYFLVSYLFKVVKVDRVFSLSLKNYPCPDILKYKDIYKLLSYKFKHFYIDDATRCIIEGNSYSNWPFVCHRGKDMISVNEDGGISSCSFAKSFTYLNKPEDILDIKIPKEELGVNSCPFIKIKSGGKIK